MDKDEVQKELRRINENVPSSYTALAKASRLIMYIAVALLILGIVDTIAIWVLTEFSSCLATLISTITGAGLFYALSAGLGGLADIALNSTQTKNLIYFKIKQDEDLFNK